MKVGDPLDADTRLGPLVGAEQIDRVSGPVVSALSFATLAEVIVRAHDTRYGLGSGVWSRSVDTIHTVAKASLAGTVWPKYCTK